MKLYLATGNIHKVSEVQHILAPFGISIDHVPEYEKIEPKEWDLEKVAGENAKRLANATGKPILVDDSGCFFNAYADFPGPLTNWAFQRLGYKGLLKLLEGEKRVAVFRCAAAVCFPKEEPVVFVGEMNGYILSAPQDLDKPGFPYERIFVIDGFDVPVCKMPKEEKHKWSHRGIAFRKLGEYVQRLHK